MSKDKETTGKERAEKLLQFVKDWQAKTLPKDPKSISRQVKRRMMLKNKKRTASAERRFELLNRGRKKR